MKLEECYGKTSTRWSSRGQNFFLIKGKNLGPTLSSNFGRLEKLFDEKKKKGYVATLLKEKRIGVPEYNEISNRISIYLHYRQIGAQPTRTNFERGSLIDGILILNFLIG
ncbi:hypothetical protein ACJX0J_004989 [Zea mays]